MEMEISAVVPVFALLSIPAVPYDVAFREIVTFVASGLKDSGEQWSDAARQAMVCTIFIQASNDGLLTMWERAS